MIFKTVISNNSSDFKEAFDIYTESFPDYEIRTLKSQEQLVSDENYSLQVIKNDNLTETIGILFSWQTDEFIFVEHFAISKNERNKNLGSKILKHLISTTDLPIILEIDPPIDDISIRRKGFYERLGFTLTKYSYTHTGFKKVPSPHDLKIMTYKEIDENLYNKFYDLMITKTIKYSTF